MIPTHRLFRRLVFVLLFAFVTTTLGLAAARDAVSVVPSKTITFYPGSFGTPPVEVSVEAQNDIHYMVRLKGNDLSLPHVVKDASGSRSELTLSSAQVQFAGFNLYTMRVEHSAPFVEVQLTPVGQNVAAPQQFLLFKALRLAVQ